MENEKKNGAPNNNENRHKRHRPKPKKSYFIEPANADSAAKPKQAEAEPKKKEEPRPNAEAKANNEEKAGGNNRKNHKNHSRHHQRHRNNNQDKEKKAAENKSAEAPNEASVTAPAPVETKNEGGKQNNQSGQKNANQGNNRNKKRNNRNHHNRDKKPIGNSENKLMLSLDEQSPAEEKKEAPVEEESYKISEMTLEEILGEVPKKDAEAGAEAEPEGEPVPMVEVVGIRFKSSGKIYYFDPAGASYHTGGHAIVETARGQEYGEVVFGNKFVKETDTVPPLRPVVRAATEADIAHHNENKEKEDAAFKICNEKILAHGLDMKLIDVQYTFDNTKLLFYFTSAGRVDFRELVKDLASVFRTRIELRQIGIRDEAKMMGGLGPCGRSLCCSLFLSDFGQVSIKMAKEQNLSLNSSKISGVCGRLMCCLRYEYETYDYEIKKTPPVESVVKTADGVGVVTEINPLAGTIKVRLSDAPDTPPKQYHRDDVTVLQRKQPQNEDNE